MKKYIVGLVVAGFSFGTMSCGGDAMVEETQIQPEDIDNSNSPNNLINNMIEDGVDKAVEEITDQITDSTSSINEMVDTLKNVINDNQEVIEDAVEQGLDALNKSFN